MNVERKIKIRSVKRKLLLHETAQIEIKKYITANGLVAGDPLPPESQLADQLGISRTAVREAVKGLEALGIVEARPGAGLYVQQFSLNNVFDSLIYGIRFEARQLTEVLDVRHLIELGMVPQVVAGRTPEQIERLRAVLAQMRKQAERGEYQYQTDEQFHRLLYANANNAFLLKILDVFWEVYREAQRSVPLPKPPDPMATYRRHVVIFDALEAGDVDAMHTAMVQHRVGVNARIRLMEESQSPTAEA